MREEDEEADSSGKSDDEGEESIELLSPRNAVVPLSD